MNAEAPGGIGEAGSAPSAISEVIPDGDILASQEAGGRFLRGTGMRVLAYGAGLLVGLASTPLVTRHLGPTDWGHFITVTSLIFIMAALTEGGVGNLGVREFSTSDPSTRRAFMSDLIGLRIVFSLVGAVGAVAFTLVAGYPRVLTEGTALAGVGLLFEALRATLVVPLTARLRLGWLAVSDFTGQFVTAVFMILLVVGGASLLPFYAVTIMASGVTLTLTAVLVRKEISLRPSFSPARWRLLLSESVVYAAATTLGVVYFQIVVVAMSLLADKVQTGDFSLAFRVFSIINVIPWLLVTSAFPILTRAERDDRERLRYALQRLFEGSLLVGAFFALCVIVGAPFAVKVVGGPKFHPAIAVLEILGVGTVGTFLVATWSFALLTLRLYRELIIANAAIIGLAVILSAVLIPSHQARGAGVVTAALELTLAAAYVATLSLRRPELRPSLEKVPRIVLAFAPAFAVALALPADSVISLAAGVAVLIPCLLAFGALPEEFLQAVRHGPGG
jgi:O-antigen/teichoic acid export membrane protein